MDAGLPVYDVKPMDEHLRVSVGTAEEMRRFMVAFKKIFADGPRPSGG